MSHRVVSLGVLFFACPGHPIACSGINERTQRAVLLKEKLLLRAQRGFVCLSPRA